MPPADKKISTFFSESLGAPLHNPRWSWGAVNQRTGQVFLRVWTDEFQTVRGKRSITILGDDWKGTSPGYSERKEHVGSLKEGVQGYGVLCTPRDSPKTGKRNIESFESDSLLQFGPLVKQGGYTFATIASSIPIINLARQWNTAESLQADVEAILATSVPATTKESLLAARLGQGRFRKQVLKAWGGQCCVTGSRTLDAIRASHIKPWSKSDDQERLDPSNGLPLIATLDALFDAGLISFASDGKMLTAIALEGKERKVLGVHQGALKLPLRKRTQGYLAYHRDNIFADGLQRFR